MTMSNSVGGGIVSYLFFLLKIRDYEMLPNFLGGNQIDAKMYGQFCGISLIHSALFGLQLPLQLYTLFAEFLG